MTLAFDETGTGPAVLLLHSTVCDRRMWDPQVAALAGAGYRAVRVDLPGYGESPMPTEPHDTAGDIAAMLDRLGIERTALVAASGGGPVALEIAARHPDRVTALVLLAAAVAGLTPSAALRAIWDREEQLLEAGDVDAAVELMLETWLGPSATAATGAQVAEMQRQAYIVQLAGDDSVEEVEVPYSLTAITAPSLLVAGAYDLADFREIAQRLSRELPGATYVELDWAGHLPGLERPEEVNDLVLDFLRRHVGVPGHPPAD
jgi:3-oxoadipate enol-lactonase